MIAEECLSKCKTKQDSDVNAASLQDCVYHGADGVFTETKGKNLGVAYVTQIKETQGPVENIEPDVDDFAYATGSRSVYLACELSAKEVYIVGHDLYSDTDKVNNIYAGTDSYADKDALAARPNNPDETFNWILQHKNTFDKFPNTQFYKVNKGAEAKTDMPIKEWSDCPNLKYITQKEMAQRLYN